MSRDIGGGRCLAELTVSLSLLFLSRHYACERSAMGPLERYGSVLPPAGGRRLLVKADRESARALKHWDRDGGSLLEA